MTYTVHEIFYTLQGEGAHSGRPAVFLRFAGCNLWSGQEQHRASAVCRFCDTEFVGQVGLNGGKFSTAVELASLVNTTWQGSDATRPRSDAQKFVVCTGGEPILQLDESLLDELHSAGFEVAVETNGTLAVPTSVDWVCVSPKANAPLQQRHGDELKLVYPQDEPEAQPARFEKLPFTHYFLQPMDGENLAENTRAAINYCLNKPQWKLSMQMHKAVGIE